MLVDRCLFLLILLPQVIESRDHGKLLILSFDGFSQNYLNGQGFVPWIRMFQKRGVYSTGSVSVFPSSTNPNHYSIATGLYPESHGIVANEFYDPVLKRTFIEDVTMDYEFWNQAEPLWITAKRQGLKTATSFWPGDAVFHEPGRVRADYRSRFVDERSTSFKARISEAFDWFQVNDVDLVMMRWYEPDKVGHKYGISTSHIDEALHKLDWHFNTLQSEIDSRRLGPVLNVVVCADHGMDDIIEIIYLEDYLNMTTEVERVAYYGALAHIDPVPGQYEAVMAKLFDANLGRFMTVYRKDHIPYYLHYSNSNRISPIVVIGNEGVVILPGRSTNHNKVGSHGWDPFGHIAMRPIFMASGPSVKTGGVDIATRGYQQMSNHEIYLVACRILKVEPRPNNCSLRYLEAILNSANPAVMSPSLLLLLPAFAFLTNQKNVLF